MAIAQLEKHSLLSDAYLLSPRLLRVNRIQMKRSSQHMDPLMTSHDLKLRSLRANVLFKAFFSVQSFCLAWLFAQHSFVSMVEYSTELLKRRTCHYHQQLQIQ